MNRPPLLQWTDTTLSNLKGFRTLLRRSVWQKVKLLAANDVDIT